MKKSHQVLCVTALLLLGLLSIGTLLHFARLGLEIDEMIAVIGIFLIYETALAEVGKGLLGAKEEAT